MLFSRPVTQPVYSNAIPYDYERANYVSAFATLGEYEPITFSIHALRDIHNLRVTVSDLRCDDHVIDQDDMDLRLVTEWNMRFPRYSSDGAYQRLPELLETVTTNSFPKNASQRYWLTVHVPTDAAPGLYKGCFTIFDDASRQATQLPILLRVLGYQLERDPAKHYSVYLGGPYRPVPGVPDSMKNTVMHNDFTSMQAHGLNMFPTIHMLARKNADGELEFFIRDPQGIDELLKMGFNGPIPLEGGIWLFYSQYAPGGKIKPHWVIDQLPDDAIYEAITRAVQQFKQQCAERGWPELIWCPMDEVATESADFASKVYAAVRKGGVATYITKDPTSSDAEIYRKRDAVDVWCSQPFAVSYEKAVADKRCDYWSYPNHISGEDKDRVVMQKGGRMTYGFGFWRSGYTTLIPWNWHWFGNKKDQFDYLGDSRVSGSGVRIDDQGRVIPAVYWECFREGYDDARYLYTLQKAIYQRRETTDARCRQLVNQGQQLIQQIWDSITPEAKYLQVDQWTDDQFTVYRWRMAKLIDELSHYPATSTDLPPSVMASTTTPNKLAESGQDGQWEICDLTENKFAGWRAVNREVSTGLLDNADRPVLRMDVHIDYETDGGGENGKYPVGWPRIRRDFPAGKIRLANYDYLDFEVRIDSDRDEVADDHTPLIVDLYGSDDSDNMIKQGLVVDLGDRQRTWIPMRVSVRDLMNQSHRPEEQWQWLRANQFAIAESRYPDKTHLSFDFRRIELVKVTEPLIASLQCANTILLPDGRLTAQVGVLGATSQTARQNYQLIATLKNKSGRSFASKTLEPAPAANLVLSPENLSAGSYLLEVQIVRKTGETVCRMQQPIEAINGYLTANP